MAEPDKRKPQKVTIQQGEITDSEYTHAEFIPDESGRYQMDMRMKHPAFVALVDGIAEWFKDNGGVNFVTLDATHPELGCLSIIVQRRAGEKTPTQRIAELEAQVAAQAKLIHDYIDGKLDADDKIAGLESERDQLAASLETARKWISDALVAIGEKQGATRDLALVISGNKALAQIAKPDGVLEERDRAVRLDTAKLAVVIAKEEEIMFGPEDYNKAVKDVVAALSREFGLEG